MPAVPLVGFGSIGVIADLTPSDVPVSSAQSPATAFTRADNIRFRDGYAQRFGGLALAAPLTQPIDAPYWLQSYNTVSGRFWVYAGVDSVTADDGTTRTDITGPTVPSGDEDDRWTGGVLSSVLVMSNGVDTPQFWGGTGDLADLPGWDPTWLVRSLRPFKQYLVGVGWDIGGDDRPHLVKWSAAAEPGAVPASWDESDATLDAGEVDLAETPDRMVDSLPMGDALIIYKDQSMWAMRQSFDSRVFTFQRLPGDVGAIAPGCIVATPVGHVLMTYGDVVLHSGQGPRSILDGRMRKWLKVRLSTDHFSRSFLAVNAINNEVWVCFPEAGAEWCTLAIVWNWTTGALGTRKLPGLTYGAAGRMPISAPADTWADQVGSWADDFGAWIEAENNASEVRLVLARGDAPGLLLADQGVLDDDNGVPLSGTFGAVLERTGLSFGEPESMKTCRGLFLRVDAPAGSTLFVQLGASNTAEESPVWTAAVPYVVGSSFKADGFTTGRFLGFRIYSVDGFDWRISSLEMDVVKRGRF